MLHLTFKPAKFLDGGSLSITDHDIGFMADNRLYQFADGITRILVITIRINHNIGTMLQRVIHTIAECPGQAHWLSMMHKMLNSEIAGHFDSFVRTAIVNNEQLDVIDAGNLCWHLFQNQRKRLLLIKTWNLDENSHSILKVAISVYFLLFYALLQTCIIRQPLLLVSASEYRKLWSMVQERRNISINN